jgi:hypothetical protein
MNPPNLKVKKTPAPFNSNRESKRPMFQAQNEIESFTRGEDADPIDESQKEKSDKFGRLFHHSYNNLDGRDARDTPIKNKLNSNAVKLSQEPTIHPSRMQRLQEGNKQTA